MIRASLLVASATLLTWGLWASTALAVAATGPATNALDLDALGERLSHEVPACVTFEQHRWMEDLGTELPSTGYFRRHPSGLVWQTLSPVEDRIELSADNRDLPPGFKALLPVLTGLLEGDWDSLEHHFRVDLSGSMAAWQAELAPRDAAIAERLKGVSLSGGDAVERLEVAFVDGDQLALGLTPVDCADLPGGAEAP
ncbi:LolA-related protein [Halomonas sp. V046]|uniref:LolA-related protein n=1 Tax=Halomonas sp. V046 TaxID=3459611 RepID=UPI004044F0EA